VCGVEFVVDLDVGGEWIMIGWWLGNEVVFDWDFEVLCVYVVFECFGDEWMVVDDGLSRNGIYVNGECVTLCYWLHDGDVILIGGMLIAFCVSVEGLISCVMVIVFGFYVGELLTSV